MTSTSSLIIAVEDDLSGAVMSKMVSFSERNFVINRVFNAHGNTRLKQGMIKFRQASKIYPHIVLTDLDRNPCPPSLLENWGATLLPPHLLVRVAVREVEAWLLADRVGISEFLHIDVSKIPHHPETEEDPKRTLINLARQSKKKRLTRDIIPASKSTATIGPFYNYHLINFVNTRWDINQACQNAQSLNRALSRIKTFLLDK